jgi:hypothetical protein
MVKIAQAERIYVAIGITKIDQLGRTPGAKTGYFFAQRPWLGIETDVYTLKRDVEERLWKAQHPGECLPLTSGLSHFA